jgi:2-oxoglutarate ferredoxin oxidoreductase subunit delta
MRSVVCRYRVEIDAERCKACGLCLLYCPKKSLKPSETFNRMGFHPMETADPERCTGCGFCALVCPDAAIEIVDNGKTEKGLVP